MFLQYFISIIAVTGVYIKYVVQRIYALYSTPYMYVCTFSIPYVSNVTNNKTYHPLTTRPHFVI